VFSLCLVFFYSEALVAWIVNLDVYALPGQWAAFRGNTLVQGFHSYIIGSIHPIPGCKNKDGDLIRILLTLVFLFSSTLLGMFSY
jgi:hypothetical protein